MHPRGRAGAKNAEDTTTGNTCLLTNKDMPMMTTRKLVDYVTAEPFRPFRIKMASGQAFEIRHPEMILVGRTSVRVYSATGDDTHDKWHDVSLMLMETVEPVDAAVSQ